MSNQDKTSVELSQYFTPLWVAEALVERHFPKLDANDLVLEPSCGRGAFLKAIPSNVPAVGVEIDAKVAQEARNETGRRVLTGNFCDVPLDFRPTAIVGNPPFQMAVVDQFLQRAYDLLPTGGRAGFLLPAYALQTAQRVAGYGERWSLMAEMIPRNLFPSLREPLSFVVFSKDSKRVMVGLALYREATDILTMPKEYKAAAQALAGQPWRVICEMALTRLGGSAELTDIYSEVSGMQPSLTTFWREKIRQVLRRRPDRFIAAGNGRYALSDAALQSITGQTPINFAKAA